MPLTSIISSAVKQSDKIPPAPVVDTRDIQPMAMASSDSDDDEELKRILAEIRVRIRVFGCGGGGSNTVNRIVEEGIVGADLYAMNTDAQHLLTVRAPHKILLGRRSTRGLGAGAQPKIGESAARESEDEIRGALQGSDLVFVTCGMGGGTGTGSAPVIGQMSREMGALTLGVVTLPFSSEGTTRMENALYGIEKMQAITDKVIVVPNDKLLEVVPRLPLNAAFKVADEILMRSIKSISDILTKVGLVNLDFADMKTIMKGGGVAMMGMGESDSAQDRAREALEDAINSPLLDVELDNATGVLVNVVGGPDMTVSEAELVAELINEKVNPNARIIWGAMIEPAMEHTIRVVLIVTGVKLNLPKNVKFDTSFIGQATDGRVSTSGVFRQWLVPDVELVK